MSKKCFLICPIGEEGSDTRRLSDIVLWHIVKPVCSEFDYEVIRSDTEFTINSINDDIFNHLDNDDLAIADLTGLNPNVFYEAGYRNAKGLPLIHIAKEGTYLPFDIRTIRTYFYGIEIDKAEAAKEALRKVIKNIEPQSSSSISNKQITSDTHKSDTQKNDLTREAKKVLKALYKNYVQKRSDGCSITDASTFADLHKIGRLSDINLLSDVIDIIKTLANLGYVTYDSDDNFYVFIGKLTDKAIKYGEDNFDEPTYIKQLREIVEFYKKNKTPIYLSEYQKGHLSDDLDILKYGDYIYETTYINGDSEFTPTNKGIKEIMSRDK